MDQELQHLERCLCISLVSPSSMKEEMQGINMVCFAKT